MAWDTEGTKQRLLDAAVHEFAERGPDGARVAAIAARACVNKERIYQYFGDKQGLFEAVLTDQLAQLAAASPLAADKAGELAEYAGHVFDYHRTHPQFLRLLHWEGLQPQGGELSAESARASHYADKVAALAAAQRAGKLTDAVAPGYLMYAVAALAAWWFAVPQVVRMVLTDDAEDPEAMRAGLINLVRRLEIRPESA
ncbi:TetR family transcriptional regulator [Nocardia sp. SYP-A9097]|uniref:TetR family transcriptional regulator n=1 Tax=Nocardia sp. SYP-A9097 TaxID=2663237 RepID=UPI00129B1D67|nr:TetR family transcriptional regulator [Nocardia sp. SYP-A9097]MRH93137.1 TetR family transcriptional regulator [Nocardia sp. SYP-A9097]